MTDRPLVSIVTPTLNSEAFLERTLRSVMSQTHPNLEHIVVDGGSTDSTLDILKKYEGAYELSWISEPDSGMYDAINKGIHRSRGVILAYLNSDDQYFPWTISAVVQTFLDAQVDMVFGDMVSIEEPAGNGRLNLYPPFRVSYLKRSAFLGQPTVFWHRRIVERFGGFDKSLQYVGDCDYWMRIGHTSRVTKLDEILALQTNHARTLRASNQDELRIELEHVRIRHGMSRSPAQRWLLFADGVYAPLRWRFDLARFLIAFHRRNKPRRGQRRWECFLLNLERQGFLVDSRRLLLAAFPFIGRRLAPGMVKRQGAD